MTDLELVKFAAKAAGIEVRYQPITRRFLYQKELPSDGFYLAYWAPLTDDGDALRLAVKLKMVVDPYAGVVAIPKDVVIAVLNEDDMMAAVRRAIVRAAAEIGKALP